MKKIVYIATVKEYYRDTLIKNHVDVSFDKKSTIDFCISIVKRKYQDLYNDTEITAEKLLKFSLSEDYSFRLFVNEKSTEVMEIDWDDHEYMINEFNNITKSGDHDMFLKLLSIGDNVIEFNYLGQVINYKSCRNYLDIHNDDYFTESECANGEYKGKLKFRKSLDTRSLKGNTDVIVKPRNITIANVYMQWKNGTIDAYSFSDIEAKNIEEIIKLCVDEFRESVDIDPINEEKLTDEQIDDYLKENLIYGVFSLDIVDLVNNTIEKRAYDYHGTLLSFIVKMEGNDDNNR